MRVAIAAVAAAAVLASAAPARAAEYEIFIWIESEEDLTDLLRDEEITEDTFDTLIELFRAGVDLNRATREELYTLPNLTYRDVDAIIAYRAEAGYITDPAALVMAGVLTERKLLSIAPFLLLREPDTKALRTEGWVRAPMVYALESDNAVPAAIQARVGVEDFTIGVAGVLTHRRLGDVRYDPTRMALSAEEPDPRFAVPKLYVEYRDGDFGAIAGSYRIGFGQRLTFDNSDRLTPNGFYRDDTITRTASNLVSTCKETISNSEVTPECTEDPDLDERRGVPDFSWRPSMRGVAVGHDHLEAGSGWVQAYGFASHETFSIFQTEIYDRALCEDPRDDDAVLPENIDCSAPKVFATRDDPLEPTTALSQFTLPDMFAETVVGGNVSYFANRRTHVGVTGYGADVNWLVSGIDLDFQEFSRFPFGGAFGAVGVDASWGRNRSDLFVEVARSFDSMPDGGGGFGALLRATGSFPKSEVEAVLRYYDRDFANPHARPVAAADEFDGLRARDETGLKLRYAGTINRDFFLRTDADFWVQASDGSVPAARLTWRSDYDFSRRYRGGLWLLYQNKNLSDNAHTGECFSGTPTGIEDFDDGISFDPIRCSGQKLQAIGRFRWAPRRRLTVTAKYQHEWEDDSREEFDDKFRQDLSGHLVVNLWPTDLLRVRARARYLFEDISDNESLEQSLWMYLDLAYRYRKDYRFRLRYDMYLRLDDRASTMERPQNPEHWFLLEGEARF